MLPIQSPKTFNFMFKSTGTSCLHGLLLSRCYSHPMKRLSQFRRRSRPLSKSQHDTDVFSLNILQRKDFSVSVSYFPTRAFHFLLCDVSVLCSLKAEVWLALPSASLHSLPGRPVLCVNSNLDLHVQHSVIMHGTDLPFF